jgi:hypothetical protein
MELTVFETSRVVLLTQVHRPAGQAYLPEVAAKVVQRYSFARHPTLDDLQKDTQIFGMGKFRDVQIAELGVYGDGVVVSGRCNTQLLNDFLDDAFHWLAAEFGIVTIPYLTSEKHFESAIVVHSRVDLGAVITPPKSVADLVSEVMERETGAKYVSSGAMIDCDPAPLRRKPIRFVLERRIGRPFSEGLFYSQAPLKTDDHLALLRDLEALRGG